jgi:actin-related protein
MVGDDLASFRERFLERAAALLPPQHLPPLYRHLLLHSSEGFVDRWRSASLNKARTFSEDDILELAVEEFVSACFSESVEVGEGSFAAACILHYGKFVGLASAFALHQSSQLFRSSPGNRSSVLSAQPPPYLYDVPGLGLASVGCSSRAQPIMVSSSRSCVSASCAVLSRTACSFTSRLARALGRGQNVMAGRFCADAASFSATIVLHRNRRLCSRILNDAVTCPIVIDCSSHMMKAGFSAGTAPSTMFPLVVCRHKLPPGCHMPMNWIHHRCGSDALQHALNDPCWTTLSFPVKNSIVTNWDDAELLFRHAFIQLNVQHPNNHPVLLTEAVMNPKANRERMVQVMFETFSVPALFVCCRPLLCLIASNRTSGVVVHCSSSSESSIVPIVDGHVLPHAMSRASFPSGEDLTDHMSALLQQRGCLPASLCSAAHPAHESQMLSGFARRSVTRRLLQDLCYVALDFDLEMQTFSEVTYVPPEPPASASGAAASIRIGCERFACPEILFRPLQPSVDGIHTATDKVINKVDSSVQLLMYRSIVLSGSILQLPGMVFRMEREMRALAPDTQVSVSAAARHSTWTGGAVMASLPSFAGKCMLYAVYDEHGPTIVHSKCPAGELI